MGIARKSIFYFGEGVDVDNENFRSPSGIALKFLYTGLDLKANRMVRKLKKALQKFMWFVVEYINRTENKSYDYEEVTFTINKAVIFNETEKIDSLVASEGMLSKRTILENHPYVDDPEQEQSRLDAEEQERVDSGMVNLANVVPTDENGVPVMTKPGVGAVPPTPIVPPGVAKPAPVVPQKKNGKVAA